MTQHNRLLNLNRYLQFMQNMTDSNPELQENKRFLDGLITLQVRYNINPHFP